MTSRNSPSRKPITPDKQDILYSYINGTSFYFYLKSKLQYELVSSSDIKEIMNDNYQLIKSKKINTDDLHRSQTCNIQNLTSSQNKNKKSLSRRVSELRSTSNQNNNNGTQINQQRKQDDSIIHDVNTQYTIQSEGSVMLVVIYGEIQHKNKKYTKGEYAIIQKSKDNQILRYTPQQHELKQGQNNKEVQKQQQNLVLANFKYKKPTTLLIINYDILKHRIQRLNELHHRMNKIQRNLPTNAMKLCQSQIKKIANIMQIKKFKGKYIRVMQENIINEDILAHHIEVKSVAKMLLQNYNQKAKSITKQLQQKLKQISNLKKSENQPQIDLYLSLPSKIYLLLEGVFQFCYKNAPIVEQQNGFIYLSASMVEQGYSIRSKSMETTIGSINTKLFTEDGYSQFFQDTIVYLINKQINKQHISKVEERVRKYQDDRKKNIIKIKNNIKQSKSKSTDKGKNTSRNRKENKSIQLKQSVINIRIDSQEKYQQQKITENNSPIKLIQTQRQFRNSMLLKSEPSFSPTKSKYSTSNIPVPSKVSQLKSFKLNLRSTYNFKNKAQFNTQRNNKLKRCKTEGKSFSIRHNKINFDLEKIDFESEYDRISTLCQAKLQRMRKIEQSKKYIRLSDNCWIDKQKTDKAKQQTFYNLKNTMSKTEFQRYANFKRVYKKCRQFPRDKNITMYAKK